MKKRRIFEGVQNFRRFTFFKKQSVITIGKNDSLRVDCENGLRTMQQNDCGYIY